MDQQPTLRDYLGILDRRKWLVILAFLVTLATTVVMTYRAAPIYRTSARVLLSGPAYVPIGGQKENEPVLLPAPSTIDTMIEMIKGPAVAQRAAGKVGLGLDAKEVQKRLTVQRVGGTDLIQIDVEDTDPIRAKHLADAVAEATIELNLEGRRRHFTDVRRYLEAQLAAATQRLREAEAALERFRSRGGNVSLSQESALKLQKLSEFEAQRVTLQVDIKRLEEEIKQARGGTVVVGTGGEGAAESPIVKELRNQLVKLEVELAGLRSQFTDEYPVVKATMAKIQETREALRREAANQAIFLESQLAALRARDKALGDIIQRLSAEVADVPVRELELARLTRDQKVAEESYLFLARKLEEARILETSIGSEVRIVSAAEVPNTPVKPQKTRNTLFGAALGLFLGIGAAFLAEFLDDTLKTPEDVERSLGVPVLGVIPATGRTRSGGLPLLNGQGSRSPLIEAFRILRTNLSLANPDRPLKTLLVTSPIVNEGKSTTAANLAISFAQGGNQVWLVNCDLRRRFLDNSFPKREGVGLSTLLAGMSELEDVMIPTGVEGLSYLPAGTSVPSPPDLLGSRRMEAFLGAARERASVAVLDSPPVVVADPVVLATKVDGVLLVVRAGQTPKGVAREAVKQLKSAGGNLLGVVLNGVPTGRSGYRYGYYYGHYYTDDGKR